MAFPISPLSTLAAKLHGCVGHLFAVFDVSYGVEDVVEEGGFS